jgi:hypothetical protein
MKTLLKLAAAGGVLLSVVVWKVLGDAKNRSDKAACGFNQRYLHQAAGQYRKENKLKPGDPLDWSKIIGPGLFIETKPVCPVHGESAYTYSPVIPEPGTLAAPCKDSEHRPAGTEDW